MKYDLENRLIEFTNNVISFTEVQPQRYAVKVLTGQLLRSCTSPALNYGEAQAAESKQDFLHKMKICLKELREAHVALRILEKRPYVNHEMVAKLIDESDQLIRIFVKSIATSQAKAA